MKLSLTREKHYAIWQYKRLSVVAILGTLEKDLGSIASCFGGEVECAAVSQEPGRDFLAAFSFNPIVDFTACRCPDRETSFVAYGLGRLDTLEFVKKAVSNSGFRSISPNKSFLEDIGSSTELVETHSYELCRKIADATNKPFSSAFGCMRYANFLSRYKGRGDSSILIAAGKFKIPFPDPKTN